MLFFFFAEFAGERTSEANKCCVKGHLCVHRASSFPERLLWYLFPSLPPSPSLSLPSGVHVPIIHTHPTHTHTHTHTHTPLSVLPVTSAVDLRLNFDELLFFFNFIFKASQLNGYCYEALGELQKKAGKEQGNALVFAQSS